MRHNYVIGNWKLNGGLNANAALLAALQAGVISHANATCAVCVPHPYLQQAQTVLHESAVQYGAQNVSEHASGAFTGEVSAAMLLDFAAKYCLVGHSERRAIYGESDALVALKFQAVKAAGITPVLCVGETLAEREAGNTEAVVARQLAAVLTLVGASGLEGAILAYEPVWAIGTGKTASPEQAQEVHAFLRAQLAKVNAQNMSILYGGSVKASNAASLFAMPDIDGALVGGAALVAAEFLGIWDARISG